jgi:hypothetical protein
MRRREEERVERERERERERDALQTGGNRRVIDRQEQRKGGVIYTA